MSSNRFGARRRSLAASVAVLAALGAAVARGEEPSGKKYLRYVDDPAKPRLETGIVTFENKDGVKVDLIGAVHIADPAYYATLNEQFKTYDALLYEMVKPRDMQGVRKIQPGERPSSWVGGLQMFMKNQLDLEYQLEGIDYSPKNFVHADLDAEAFAEKQAERGESMLTLMLNSMLRELARQQNDPNGAAGDVGVMDLVNALQAPDRSRQLKLVLAKQFENMDAALDAMGGPDGSVILDERNKVALKVLKEQIDGGKKHLGIFYGAGHLRGMEEILTDLMGFKPVGAPKYLVAWDLSAPEKAKPATRPIVADGATTKPAAAVAP